jgi:hypothetical protein
VIGQAQLVKVKVPGGSVGDEPLLEAMTVAHTVTCVAPLGKVTDDVPTPALSRIGTAGELNEPLPPGIEQFTLIVAPSPGDPVVPTKRYVALIEAPLDENDAMIA